MKMNIEEVRKIRTEREEKKWKIMERKRKLKGTEICIEMDKTFRERKI